MAYQALQSKQIYIGYNGTPRLPSAYQEVEYLQSQNVGESLYYSSLAPYIDTWFVPDENTKVEFKIWWWTQQWSYQMFGVREFWNNNWRWFAIVSDAYQFDTPYILAHWMIDWNIHTGSFGQDWFYVDGDLKTTPPTATFTAPRNLYLFWLNDNGLFREYAYIKYYSFKIYDNWTLVRDFIPCYQKYQQQNWNNN